MWKNLKKYGKIILNSEVRKVKHYRKKHWNSFVKKL